MFPLELLNFVFISENIWAIHPYGPKMCLLICQNHPNCTLYVFDEVHLECQLVFNTTFGKRSSGERDNEDGTPNQGTGGHSCSQGHTVKKPGCPEEDVDLFHEACLEGYMVDVKRYLCQGVVDVNCRDNEKNTAAMFAVKGGEENIFDFLVKQNANLTALDKNEYNVLHYACDYGYINIVRKLVDDLKMDIEARTDIMDTPLFHAVYNGHIQIVKFLIERGADVEIKNKYESNILIEACSGNNFDMVKYVLSLNVSVDIDSRDLYGKTPIDYAIEKGDKQTEELLRNRGAHV